MSFRRTELGVAVLGLGFPAMAFAAGMLGLSELWLLMLAIGALGAWAWLRQRQLAELTFRQRAVRGTIIYALTGFALLLAFELGQFLGRHN